MDMSVDQLVLNRTNDESSIIVLEEEAAQPKQPDQLPDLEDLGSILNHVQQLLPVDVLGRRAARNPAGRRRRIPGFRPSELSGGCEVKKVLQVLTAHIPFVLIPDEQVERAEARMAAGSKFHESLEAAAVREIGAAVDVRVRTDTYAEWACQFLVIAVQQFALLSRGQRVREVVMMGQVEGELFWGFADEVEVIPSSLDGRPLLRILEDKTTGRLAPPEPATQRSHALQILVYHSILSDLQRGHVDPRQLAASLALDWDEPIGGDLRALCQAVAFELEEWPLVEPTVGRVVEAYVKFGAGLPRVSDVANIRYFHVPPQPPLRRPQPSRAPEPPQRPQGPGPELAPARLVDDTPENENEKAGAPTENGPASQQQEPQQQQHWLPPGEEPCGAAPCPTGRVPVSVIAPRPPPLQPSEALVNTLLAQVGLSVSAAPCSASASSDSGAAFADQLQRLFGLNPADFCAAITATATATDGGAMTFPFPPQSQQRLQATLQQGPARPQHEPPSPWASASQVLSGPPPSFLSGPPPSFLSGPPPSFMGHAGHVRDQQPPPWPRMHPGAAAAAGPAAGPSSQHNRSQAPPGFPLPPPACTDASTAAVAGPSSQAGTQPAKPSPPQLREEGSAAAARGAGGAPSGEGTRGPQPTPWTPPPPQPPPSPPQPFHVTTVSPRWTRPIHFGQFLKDAVLDAADFYRGRRGPQLPPNLSSPFMCPSCTYKDLCPFSTDKGVGRMVEPAVVVPVE